jgi:hypothetical protein
LKFIYLQSKIPLFSGSLLNKAVNFALHKTHADSAGDNEYCDDSNNYYAVIDKISFGYHWIYLMNKLNYGTQNIVNSIYRLFQWHGSERFP